MKHKQIWNSLMILKFAYYRMVSGNDCKGKLNKRSLNYTTKFVFQVRFGSVKILECVHRVSPIPNTLLVFWSLSHHLFDGIRYYEHWTAHLLDLSLFDCTNMSSLLLLLTVDLSRFKRAFLTSCQLLLGRIKVL